MLRSYGKFIFSVVALCFAMAAQAQPVNDLLRHTGDPVAGNKNGKVTVVEFFDYQCSHCVKMAPVISDVIKANPDVRIVFKDFPIRGPQSEMAARAALAASMQGKYVAFSHALLASTQDLSENNIMDIARSVGLNMDQLKRDMNGKKVNAILKNTLEMAQKFNLTGTPAFFIAKTNAKDSNDVNFVLGEMSQSELQKAIDKANK